MRVALLAHHGKEKGIEDALRRHDFQILDPYGFNYDLVLADTDHPQAVPYPEKHALLQECKRRGIPIVLYPHGAMVDLDYDGLRPQALPISLRLVHGVGHVEVARRMGCKHRVEAIGWSFCDLAGTPRRPERCGDSPSVSGHNGEEGEVRSLLFAPIHPWANGVDILPFHKGLNTAAYHQFLDHPAKVKTVRMYGADQPNGITERVDGVTYTQSDLGAGVNVIDAHDAVISYGTFGYTALARGKPVAMIYAYPGHTDDLGNIHARRFEEYREYVAYPASLGDAPLDELFARDVSTWKDLFVGGPLDEEKLVGLLREFRANRAQRRKLAKMR